MAKNLGRDRRYGVRVSLDIVMNLVIFDAEVTGLIRGKDLIKLRRGKVSDISITGLRVETSDIEDQWLFHMLSGRVQIALKLQLPKDKDPINAIGKIVWIDSAGHALHAKRMLGIKFMEISAQDKVKITDYMKTAKKIPK